MLVTGPRRDWGTGACSTRGHPSSLHTLDLNHPRWDRMNVKQISVWQSESSNARLHYIASHRIAQVNWLTCPKGGRRIEIWYKFGGQEALYEYAPRSEFAIATPSSPSHAESPEPPKLLHDEALMDALVEPPKPGVDAESPQPPPIRISTPTRELARWGNWDWSVVKSKDEGMQ